MIAYLDSSVLLRLILGQPGALGEWTQIDSAVVSALVEVECLRTLDRLRLAQSVSGQETAKRRESVYRLLELCEVVQPTPAILSRAGQPLPGVLGTLDAIHLATALMWREWKGEQLYMATHDTALALASRGSGFPVIGC